MSPVANILRALLVLSVSLLSLGVSEVNITRNITVPVMQNVTQLAYMPLRLECQGFVTNETVYWEYMNEPLEFEVAPTVYELSTGQLRHSGRYICRSQITNEKLTIFDVTINEACPMGFLFPILDYNSTVRIPCEDFHSDFNRFHDATRTCGEPKVNNQDVYDDFSQCTLKEGASNYIVFFRFFARFPGGLSRAMEVSDTLLQEFRQTFDRELSVPPKGFQQRSIHRTRSEQDIEIVYSFTVAGTITLTNLTTSLSSAQRAGVFYEAEDFRSADNYINVVQPSSFCDCFNSWEHSRSVHVDQFCNAPNYLEEVCDCNIAARETCRTEFNCSTGYTKVSDSMIEQLVCAVDLDSDGRRDDADLCVGCCPRDTLYGLTWPETAHNLQAALPCSGIHPSFTSTSLARRRCGPTGDWEEVVNFDACTFQESTRYPVILYTAGAATFGPVIEAVSDIEMSLSQDFNNSNITVTIQDFSFIIEDSMEFTRFRATFLIEVLEDTITEDLRDTMAGILRLNPEPQKRSTSTRTERQAIFFQAVNVESQGFIVSSNCTCGVTFIPMDSSSLFRSVCSGQGLTPCSCMGNDMTNCECSDPYIRVSDMSSPATVCSPDTDADGIADPMDNCVNLFSPDNSCIVPTGAALVGGCPAETDRTWMYTWDSVPADSIATQRCQDPPVNISGVVTRQCRSNGNWETPDTSDCRSIVYVQAADALGQLIDRVRSVPLSAFEAEQVRNLTNDLLEATMESLEARSSIFAADLEATTDFIGGIARLAEDNNLFDLREYRVGDIVTVANNLLERPNRRGWETLNVAESMNGPPEFLRSIERLSRGVGAVLRNSREPVVEFVRRNIVITAFTIESASGNFDKVEVDRMNINNTDTDFDDTELPMLRIPGGFLREVDDSDGALDNFVPITYTVIKNIDVFLPRRFSSRVSVQNSTTDPASTIFSAQVGVREPDFDSPTLQQGTPIEIILSINSTAVSSTTAFCTFWNFTTGGWDNDGVSTAVDAATSQATCSSTHLTSFTVLVDSSGTPPEGDAALAFSILTYIGCAISIVCLILTIIFIFTMGKEIITKVNYFVLLNLSFALLIALIIFVAGIQTATWNVIPCTIVAALLHYFFLAAFSWTLCEAVLIYNLLVKVFGAHKRRWIYIYSALGWGTPVPVLIVTLASRWDYYYIRESTNHTSNLYHELRACWLSSEVGVIWAFIAPMIAIIIVNTVLLAISMYHLYKSRFGKGMQKIGEDDGSSRKTAKQLIKAIIILMPLMGVTWIIGLFAVSAHPATYIFSIAFIVLNTLQGAAIFFFHVVRHDKIWGKLTLACAKARGKAKPSTGTSSQTAKTKTTKGTASPALSTRSKTKYDTSSVDNLEAGNAPNRQEEVPDEKIELEYLNPPTNAQAASRESLASIHDHVTSGSDKETDTKTDI